MTDACWIPVRGTWETQREVRAREQARAGGPAARLRWYRRGSTFQRFLADSFGLDLLDFDADPETPNTPLWSGALQGTLWQAFQGWLTGTRKADWENGGERLHLQIRRAVADGRRTIVVVAFSHGGQVALYALAHMPVLPSVRILLVTVDTPIRRGQMPWHERARARIAGHVHFHTSGLRAWVRWAGARSIRRTRFPGAANIEAPGHGDPLGNLAAHAVAWRRAFESFGIPMLPAPGGRD